MKLTPFSRLEDFARQEYRRKYAKSPEPKIINADALVALNRPRVREFEWAAVRYHAPPTSKLSFADGHDLLVVANALYDMRRARVNTDSVRRTAARLVHKIAKPVNRLRRLVPVNAFLRMEAEHLENLMRKLLHIPDASVSPPATEPVTIDLVDQYYTFRAIFGEPKSWADYVYGIRHIGRAMAREDLRAAVAARVGQLAETNDWKEYEHNQRQAAGWVH